MIKSKISRKGWFLRNVKKYQMAVTRFSHCTVVVGMEFKQITGCVKMNTKAEKIIRKRIRQITSALEDRIAHDATGPCTTLDCKT